MEKSFIGRPVLTTGGALYINPGTGPVDNATLQEAEANIVALIEDAGFAPDEVKVARRPDLDEAGRFGFVLHWKRARFCSVEMPGLPLAQVCFQGLPQNPWDFPRLYVDGGSWLWCYAVNCVADSLKGEEDTDD